MEIARNTFFVIKTINYFSKLLDKTTSASKQFLSFRYRLILSFYSIDGGTIGTELEVSGVRFH